ncbi:MAG TPA: ABC transporter substrate-binding protein [Thermoanaerobaculia bacterium]|nr:ABC transporter substrate-binding protein [Thermoanaerobaculia bacterium]
MLRRVVRALLVVVFVACGRETPQPPPQPPPKTSIVEPEGGGRVVRRLETDPETLNYVLHSTEDERQVLELIYDPILELDENLNPIPALATRWEVLDGGKTYVFHLDPRATYSDGKPVLASDVVFTLHKILDEESIQFASYFETLDRENTKALDEHTARVVFKSVRAGQLLSFNIGVMPEHVFGKGDFKKNRSVVGSGPYTLKRRQIGRSILLERREDYWRTKPRIREVLFRPIGDDAVTWKALERGDIDVGRATNDTWFRVKDDPKVAETLVFHNVWQLTYNAVAWNLDDPLFADARVRRALAMCYDRNAVIEQLYHGQARPVTGPFVQDSWAANPDVQPIEYNLAGATALLGSAGWRDTDGDGVLDRNGKKFTFTMLIVAGNKISVDHAQILQDAWKKVGVQLEVRPVDGTAYSEQVFGRNFQSAFVAWVIDPDPSPRSLFHSKMLAPAGMNVIGYRNAEADDLMDRAEAELDPSRRQELYHQLHAIIARDQPYLFTVQSSVKWATNKRVQNVKVAKGFGLFHWYPGPLSWWLREEPKKK